MCEIVIDQVDTDTLQQATRLTALVSGHCDHGGELYMRPRWNGRLGPESAFIPVGATFSRTPITWTAHNHSDHLEGIRVVCRCKATSVFQECEV